MPSRDPSSPEPRLRLALQRGPGVAALPLSRSRLRRLVAAALESDCQITLRFVGAAEGRRLNATYRGRDYATNVLTFPYGSGAADIVLCVPVIRREAREQGKLLDQHTAHLVIHGVLHAQGHDHEDPVAAARMEAIETALLARFRIADPYRDRLG